ncbi:HET-domain-containing protein [Acephala macrosclerotiorum]|nr:HET-domain-containing protein [Acephala macrosclerotiorum]
MALRNRLAKIPLKALPKTFSEAIKATRKLGVRYIWIDSLCIIQDSLEDWQRESVLMGKVYSNCLCTIAAADSKDCHGGLIQAPEGYAVLRSWSKDDSDTGMLLKPTVQLWDKVLEASPFNRRGWTLQERELSPRILYFTKDTMHFECREARGIGNLSLRHKYDDYELKPKGSWERNSTIRLCMDPIYTRNGGAEWLESSSLVPQKTVRSLARNGKGIDIPDESYRLKPIYSQQSRDSLASIFVS